MKSRKEYPILKLAIVLLILFGGKYFAQDWKCIITGETRNNKPEHKQVLQSIMTNTPDFKFIISVGDVVDHGDNENEWSDWYNTVKEVLGDLGQEQTPPRYMATPGNHDATETTKGLANWNKYLSGQGQQFGNEGKFFTFDYQDARFIILDSDKSSKTGAQYDMMMNAITNNPEKWLFVITHRPIFEFGNYSYNDEIHDTWGVPLYQHGCDIIFNGHNHFYLRTKKLELNGNINPPLDPENGTTEIITGNGGVSLRDVHPDKDNNGYIVEKYMKDYGYTEMHFKNDSLYVKHILRDGTVFDSVVYTPNTKNITAIGKSEIPDEFALLQNYPNPFNISTIIKIKIPSQTNARLEIFDTLGRIVKVLFKEKTFTPGVYSVSWDGKSETGEIVSNGIYVYKLTTKEYMKSLKMILLK